MILAADIGGTKLLYGLFETVGDTLAPIYKQRYASLKFSSLEEATDAFLAELPKQLFDGEIQTACFSVAGPVVDGTCTMTNLGWDISETSLRSRFPRFKQTLVRNDMEAMGKGLALVAPEDIVPLMTAHASAPRHPSIDDGKTDQVFGILVPGTGLGEAYIMGGKVMASEGGHCDFGPRNRLQVELWEFLHRETNHVSYERILSGEGFCRLVRFIMDEKGLERLDFPLVPEEITKRATDSSDAICVMAVEMFADILGAEAGNLALKTMALGGIYLGGNIIKEMIPWLKTSCFSDGFFDKGRFSDLMKTIPVYGVMDSDTVLYGSALMAAEMER